MGKQLYVNSYEIHKFDTKSSDKKYRLISSKCDIEINDRVKDFIEFARNREGKDINDIINEYVLESEVEAARIRQLIEVLFEKNILTDSLKNKVTEAELSKGPSYRNEMKRFWFRFTFIDTDKYASLFKKFSFVFSKPFVITVLSAFIILDILFFYTIFFCQWDMIYFFTFDYLILFILVILNGIFHEFGHIAACKMFNISTPQGIGFGIYYYLIVFFSDTHEAWKLSRKKRMIISVAGFYWELIYFTFFLVFFFITKSFAVHDFILLFHLSIIRTFNPFLKMDGYWFLSDSFGMPNLHEKIKVYVSNQWSRLFNKKITQDPFVKYPKKERISVRIYVFLYYIFIFIFIGFFAFRATNIALDFNGEIITKVVFLVYNLGADEWAITLNHLFRNSIILVAALILFYRLFVSRIVYYLRGKNKRT